jgi:hypothetical protein
MSSLWVSGLFQKAARFLDRRGRWRAYGRLIEMGILAWGSPGERDTEARIVEDGPATNPRNSSFLPAEGGEDRVLPGYRRGAKPPPSLRVAFMQA